MKAGGISSNTSERQRMIFIIRTAADVDDGVFSSIRCLCSNRPSPPADSSGVEIIASVGGADVLVIMVLDSVWLPDVASGVEVDGSHWHAAGTAIVGTWVAVVEFGGVTEHGLNFRSFILEEDSAWRC